MICFDLERVEDETGISGTGIVAQGVLFDDGTVALRWLTKYRSFANYGSIDDVTKIHGHNGKTIIRWRNAHDAFERARIDCIQDGYENCPFASIGGLDARVSPVAPDYVLAADRAEYVRGYTYQAHRQYGEEWRTCSFEWFPVTVTAAMPQKEGGG